MEIYMVYGITDCPACLRACADLMERDLEYVFIETDFSKTYRAAIKEEFGLPSFPIIVRVEPQGEMLLGGHEELQSILSTEDPSPT